MSYSPAGGGLTRSAWFTLGAIIAVCFIAAVGWADLHQSPPHQHAQQRCAEQPTANASLKSATVQQPQADKDCDARAEAKKRALESLLERVNSFFDFRITDAFLVIFTWILAVKTSGLFTETAGLRRAADEQRTELLRSVKAAENSANAAKNFRRCRCRSTSAMGHFHQNRCWRLRLQSRDGASLDDIRTNQHW
jgi:hypothetical protein